MDRAAMTSPRFSRPVCPGNRGGGHPLFLDHLTGLLIHAKAFVRRLLHHSPLGPASILHFGNQFRLDENRAGFGDLVCKRIYFCFEFCERSDQLAMNFTGVAGANAAGITKAFGVLPAGAWIRLVVTQQEAADARMIVTLFRTPSADYQLLALND